MSIIHIVDRQSDEIIDDITEKYILDNIHERSLKDNLESFEFVTFGDKRFSQYLEKRNKIIIPKEEEKNYQEFIISESIKIHEDETIEVEVFADASYLELKKATLIEPQIFTEYTASMAVSRALRDTAWSVGIIESTGYRTFAFNEHTNPYSFIKRIASEFDLEINFRVEIDGHRIIGRYVDLVERIGQWHGVEVEFGKNLQGIRRTENTDNVVTALKGLGPEREDGSRLEVIIRDNDALDRWGILDKNGEVQHLIETYEPESDREDMTIDELAQYTRTELDKRIKEVVEYEGNIYDLEHVPGLKNIQIRFGDTIRIKDTKFNPPLYLEARIHTQKRNIVDKSQKQVTLGDYIEYTEEEVTRVWQELQDEIRRKVDLYQMLEYTYDKETIDTKDEIVLGDGQEYSRNVAKDAEDNAKEHADNVASEAERLAKEYAEGEINASESRILEATVAKAIFEATIDDILDDLAGKASNSVVQDLQDEVATKVDGEWVDGRLSTKADADSVYTIEELDNMFDNVVSITEYTTDKEGFLDTFSDHETRISQTETEITTKVERTEFEAIENEIGELGTSIENAWTEINQNADDIALKASQSSVDTLTKEVSDLEAELTIQAGKIASKVEQSEFDSVTNTLGNDISRVEQTAQGISQEVSSVRADLDGLEIGGRNLALGTSNELTTVTVGQWGHSGMLRVPIDGEKISHGDNVTFSVYIQDIPEGEAVRLRLDWYREDGTYSNVISSDPWSSEDGRYVFTATVPENTEFTEIRGRIIPRNWVESYPIQIKEEQLEKGNKATDWTPAPEDVDSELEGLGEELSRQDTRISQNADEIALRATKSEVDTLKGRVDTAESEITANAEQIELRATKTSVDALAGRVSTAESTITQHADSIEARVEKDGVIAAINLSSESATINASKINLVGAVTVLSDITGNLGSITAGDITGVNIKGSEILQEGADGSILLDNTGLHKLDDSGVKRVSISNENWEFQGFSPASIVLNPENYAFSIVEGGHGLGDAFIGYPDGGWSDSQFNIWNQAGVINLGARDIQISNHQHTLRDNNGDFRIQSTGGYVAFASQYDKMHLQSDVGVHVNEWLSAIRYTDLYTGVVRSQTQYVIDTTAYTGTTYIHIKKNTMLGVYEEDGTYIIDFRGNIGSANNKSIRMMNLESYTTSASANLHISSAYNVVRSTSARKYKKDIEPIEEWRAEQFFEEAKPVWFRGNGDGDIENYSYYGYVADDIAKIEPRLVEFSNDNEPEGFAYDRVPALLHVVMKKDRKRLDELARVSDEHTDEIELLKIENKLLKKRVEKLERGA